MIAFRPWLLAVFLPLLLASTSCEPLDRHRLRGTYYRSETSPSTSPALINQLTLTETKCIMTLPLGGEVAQDYKVEDGLLYVGGAEGQICFTIEGLGILRNKGTLGLEGTYVKLDKSRPGD